MHHFQYSKFCYTLLPILQCVASDTSLPLRLSCEELTQLEQKGTTIMQHNLPKGVTCWIHGESISEGNGGACETMVLPRIIDTTFYITLFKEKNSVCATRQLIQVKENVPCPEHVQRIPGYNKPPIIVNWQKKCDLTALLGTQKKLFCDNKYSPIQWHQYDKYGKLIMSTRLTSRLSKLIITVEDFDRDTAIVCSYADTPWKNMRFPITVVSAKSSNKTMQHYHDNTQITLQCPAKEGSTSNPTLITVQNKVIQNAQEYKKALTRSLYKDDDGLTFYCVHWIQRSEYEIERQVTDVIIYIQDRGPQTVNPIINKKLPATDSPLLPKPAPETLFVGDNYSVKCIHKSPSDKNLKIHMHQSFPSGNLTLKYPSVVNDIGYILNTTLQDFDNGTKFSCSKYNNFLPVKTVLLATSSKLENTYLKEIYYNERREIDIDCNEFRSNYTMLLKTNNHIRIFSPEMSQSLTKADNTSILYCVYFVPEANEIITRHVVKKGFLIYLDLYEDFKEYYYIGGIIAGLLIILLIIIILYVRRQCGNSSRKHIKPNEDNSANTGQVTYAELQLKPCPDDKRRPVQVEDTPYAEIILHTSERSGLQQRTLRSDDTESPYVNC